MKKRDDINEKRNHIFAAAFDELKRNHGIKTQKELAEKMGVSKDTVTRILKIYQPVTEDIITKLQTASGCIFNLQWLRGESDVMLVADLTSDSTATKTASPPPPDYAVQVIAVKDEMIAALRQQLHQQQADKDETIAALRQQLEDKDNIIATKDALISNLQQQLYTVQIQTSIKKGLSDGVSKRGTVEPKTRPRATR